MPRQNQIRPIVLFLALTLLFSAGFWALVIAAKSHGGSADSRYVVGLMWSPGLAAILTTAWLKLDWRTLGFGWGGGRWALFAYLIPIAYAAIAYGLIWSFGFGRFPDPETMAELSGRLGWKVSQPVFLMLYPLLLGSTGMVAGVSHALGEEIGWRGFLAPRLAARFGYSGGAVIGGLIWAAWHYPLIFGAHYDNGGPWQVSVLCFTAMVVGLAFVLSWVRLRTDSVWPCAILHASHNLFIQGFFTPLTAKTGPYTLYAVDEFGAAVPAVVAIFALVFWSMRRRLAPVAGVVPVGVAA